MMELVRSNAAARAAHLPSPLRGGVGGGGPQMTAYVVESCGMDDRQRTFARRMRAEPTDAEGMLCQRLRHDIVLTGSHFRRQAAIGPFIVDFASRKAKLVIELDGGQHFSDEAERKDAMRSAVIEARGFRILRFSNHDVMTNRTGVLETIAAAVAARAPTLTLPRKRGRERAGST